jgi:hypothetical protein
VRLFHRIAKQKRGAKVAHKIARISSRVELENLIAARRFPARIVFQHDLLQPEQRARWESILNRELSVCGCGQASFAALIATAVLTAMGLTWLADWSWPQRLALVFFGSGTAMTVSKGLTILRARQRCRADLLRLLASLESQVR